VLHLDEGNMVVLATDGFFEWEDASGEQFDFECLEQAVREACYLAPEEIIAEIYNSVKHFAAGTKQTDDLTSVVIKRMSRVA
jgi:sigma-B regulation protein RsbU (phosphoserine phosphatase)